MKTVGGVQFFSVSEAKSILPKIVDGLQVATVLLRRSEPVAALVSIEKYNDYLALEKLIRHPELFDRLRAQAKKAGTTPIASLRTMKDLEALYETSAAPTLAAGR
jgi:PHD/YefM family antitoxin component YafN of YafNO toxin-antitoxin module